MALVLLLLLSNVDVVRMEWTEGVAIEGKRHVTDRGAMVVVLLLSWIRLPRRFKIVLIHVTPDAVVVRVTVWVSGEAETRTIVGGPMCCGGS